MVLVRVQPWQPFSGCIVSSRRPCSERGGRRCNSCHPDHFWKAGSYKLGAPVPKTGSPLPRPEHYRRLPPFNHQTRGVHHDNHSSIRAEVATRPATKAHTGKTKSRHQEGPTGPPNAAEPVALSDLFPRTTVLPDIERCGVCNSGQRLAYVKGERNESDPLPKPIAPTAQLQAKPCHSNSPGESAV